MESLAILTINQLSDINAKMLQRGAPVWDDGVGYNKPDYSICCHIYYGMSYAQATDLCDRLQKYVKSQLPEIDITDLQESKDYYKKLAGYKPGITLHYNNDYTAFYFAYDADIINTIKTANNRKYNPEKKCWYVANNEVIKILDKLSSIADVENAKQYFLSQYKPTETTTAVTKIKLIITDKNDKINIKTSKYHAGYVQAVKACNDRKYNPNDYSWTISKVDITALIDRLQPFANEIDITALSQYISTKNPEQEINLIPLQNAQRKPFNHQLQAAKFLLQRKKAILADEMGGGKTTSAIIASYNITGKKLVVCPASLKLNWKKEILLVDKTAKIGIINGKTIADLNSAEWIIINYDIISKHIDSILNTNFTSVIFDECHYIKSINNSGKPTALRG